MDAIQQIEFYLGSLERDSIYYGATVDLLRHLTSIRDLNVTQIADLCCVAPSTISKLIRRMGFTDFTSFKIAVAESIANHESGQFDILMDYDRLKNHFDVYLDSFKARILNTLSKVNYDDFTRAARMLWNAKRVLVVSQSSHPDSCLSSDLIRTGKEFYFARSVAEEEEFAEMAAPGDAVIALIFNNTESALKPLDMIRGKGGMVITIANEREFMHKPQQKNRFDVLFMYDSLDVATSGFIRNIFLRHLLGEYRALIQG